MELLNTMTLFICLHGCFKIGVNALAADLHENITLSLEALQRDTEVYMGVEPETEIIENKRNDITFSSFIDLPDSNVKFISILFKTVGERVIKKEMKKFSDTILNKINEKVSAMLSFHPDSIIDEADDEMENKLDEGSDTKTSKQTRPDTGKTSKSKWGHRRHGHVLAGQFLPSVQPFVTVEVSDPKVKDRQNILTVPLVAEMTVLDSLIAVTQAYIDEHGRHKDVPFNVIMDWDHDLKCFTIVRALGTKSRRRSMWFISVIDRYDQVIYKERCLPEDGVILRPQSVVRVTFDRVRRNNVTRQKGVRSLANVFDN